VTLVADHVAATVRLSAEQERVDSLIEAVKTDSVAAKALHGEREQQTERSLARDRRQQWLAWMLLIAGAAAVLCGKWYLLSAAQKLPTLDALVTERFAVPTGAPPTPRPARAAAADADGEVDLSFIGELVARYGSRQEAAIPILQAIQSHYGYLPDAVLERVCQMTEITPAQFAGTSSFYAQFRRAPIGRHLVRVCHGTACHVAGVEHITQELRRHLELAPDQDTDPHRLFTIQEVACLGCCSLAPVMMINGDTAGHLTPSQARQALEQRELPS
jgi:NADH:ubiquinone oxidoreductase subunit E